MNPIRPYATAATISIPLYEPGSIALATSKTLEAGDVQVSLDGGSFANITTLPAESPSGSGFYDFEFSAAELTCARLAVKVSDQSGTAEFDDDNFVIETYGNASGEHANLGVAHPDNFAALAISGAGAIEAVESVTGNVSADVVLWRGATPVALPASGYVPVDVIEVRGVTLAADAGNRISNLSADSGTALAGIKAKTDLIPPDFDDRAGTLPTSGTVATSAQLATVATPQQITVNITET